MAETLAKQRDADSTMEEMESMSRVQWIISIMPIAYCIGIALLFRLPLLYHHAGEVNPSSRRSCACCFANQPDSPISYMSVQIFIVHFSRVFFRQA
jgi:hypothetical protein